MNRIGILVFKNTGQEGDWPGRGSREQGRGKMEEGWGIFIDVEGRGADIGHLPRNDYYLILFCTIWRADVLLLCLASICIIRQRTVHHDNIDVLEGLGSRLRQ